MRRESGGDCAEAPRFVRECRTNKIRRSNLSLSLTSKASSQKWPPGRNGDKFEIGEMQKRCYEKLTLAEMHLRPAQKRPNPETPPKSQEHANKRKSQKNVPKQHNKKASERKKNSTKARGVIVPRIRRNEFYPLQNTPKREKVSAQKNSTKARVVIVLRI